LSPALSEVCKFAYKGSPHIFNDSIIIVPSEMVALSEYQYVPHSFETLFDTMSQPAIMFLIDNSNSMKAVETGIDRMGNRFTVTHDLIDTVRKYSPYAEIGVAVFNNWLHFDPKDDPIFVQCPQQSKGAFIPPLRLNRDYNGKKGYDILKHYLAIDTVLDSTWHTIVNKDTFWIKDSVVILKYQSEWGKLGSTNINDGFNAVRKGMTLTPYIKENQYVLFFSDGEATFPNDSSKNNYIKGDNVPTTFTVYFTKETQAPKSLQDMTKNIQNNGYSTTNPKSNLWANNNSSKQSLMKFLMDNVIKFIIKKNSQVPTGMIINSSAKMTNYDSIGFRFPELFPLLGTNTDFKFILDYHIQKDSVTSKGETIKKERDTTITVRFKVTIDPKAPKLPAPFEVKCWDRSIEFFHKGNKITLADELMSDIDLRFTEIEGTTRYGYTNVVLDVSTTSSHDHETIALDKSGNFFTKNSPLELVASAVPGDKKIQVHEFDTIVTVFRNPKLPLDTLVALLPFHLTTTIEVMAADYYDVSLGDGLIDSISVETKEPVTQEQLTEIITMLQLPPWRKLTIKGSCLLDKGFGLVVQQDVSAGVCTFTTAADVLVVKQAILKSKGLLLSKSVTIGNKIAPLIEAGKVRSYIDKKAKDTLTIAFTEKIQPTTTDQPFMFKAVKQKGVVYTGQLKLLRSTDSIMTYEVLGLTGLTENIELIRNGDSVWISVDKSHVIDIKDNAQRHPNNRRRALDVERMVIPFNLIGIASGPVSLVAVASRDESKIPPIILDVLNRENRQELKATNDCGMLIQVKPDKEFKTGDIAISLAGTMMVVDGIGDIVIPKRKMSFLVADKTLNYGWNMKNSNGRTCGIGSYQVLFDVTSLQGPDSTKTIHPRFSIMIGVRE
ncbi:MAG: hypothetical protein JW795_00420, partial [Chitinivibrionales bacterium]|nr:hypothetical protein [Chitinivibrionales bacterium]